jgi:tetratricopeptide (TPR) repeat protein
MTLDSEGLHPIANTDKPDRQADIVFVHGLGGFSHGTWRHGAQGRDGHFFWPEELGKELPQCGIWTVGYPAGLTAWGKPGMIIEKRAGNLSQKLANAGVGTRPLLFITHSMGGLIVKSFIVDSQILADPDRKRIVSMVRGIVFCATPHRGSAFADAAGVLGKFFGGSQDHVDEMRANAEPLDFLHDQFIEWHRNHPVPVESYAESVGLFRTRGWRRPLPLGLVVPRASANPGIAGHTVRDVDDDHLTLVKPRNRQHDVYASVLRFIGDALTPPAALTSTATVSVPSEPKRSVAATPAVRDQVHATSWITWISKLPQRRADDVFEGREKVLTDLDALWADALAQKAGRAQIVSLVAIGGAGKTTVASRWKDALLARDGHGGVERYFDWSFYSQGTRREGDNASAQTAADSTVFVAAALKFFGDSTMADSAAPAWDKGARLAALVAQHRTLLILDGLEPLQHPPGPQTGELKDDALLALFAGLQSAGRGLCVITTREPIADFAATRGTTTPEWRLDHLTDAAGALVLKRHGVTGPDAELQSASAEVKGHALTLALMGRYLRLAFDPPDIARRDGFHFSEADAETQNGHAFRVIAAYERWFEREGRHVEAAILRMLGLFDRPATPDCLAALCTAPVILGLTEPLVGLGERQWNTALQRLRELDLIETVEWVPGKVTGYGEKEARTEMAAGRRNSTTNLGPPQPFEFHPSSIILRMSLDAHPLLREYFDAQLKQRGIAPAAHARLYEHLCASVPYWPEGRDGLLPLYQAVAHGCKAGRFQRACNDIYASRIQRGTAGRHAAYSTKNLGLLGLDLGAVACFFVEPWRRLATELTPADQSWLLNEAAFSLRALNRLAEAREPSRAGLDMDVQQEDWRNAALQASFLSELELALGDVPAAETVAAESVAFADRSPAVDVRVICRSKRADVLHQAGRLEASRTLFAEAEKMQGESQPDYTLLYSLRGYQYCDLLLATAERAAWQRSVGFQPVGSPGASPGESGGKMPHEPAVETAAPFSDLDAIERRAAQTREWVTAAASGSLFSIALDHLAMGRVHLLRAILQDAKVEASNPELLQAREYLDTALATLRQSNISHSMPGALLPRAWLHALVGQWDAARQRLDEAFALATRGGNAQNGWRGGMRLILADILLYRARLFGRTRNETERMNRASQPPAEYPWPGRTPARDLAEATALITACGYHRRDEELADAMAAIA